MHYQQIDDLPESVKASLPEPAQHIFLDAFNEASKKYEEEEHAMRVAWGAVSHTYQRCDDGKWHKRPE